MVVPGGATSDQVRLIDCNIRLGKFFSFTCAAAVPLIASIRDATTGSISMSGFT